MVQTWFELLLYIRYILPMSRPKLLIFVPAYNASSTIEWVLSRIPADLADSYTTHVLVIDDASEDDTAKKAQVYLENAELPFEFTVLANPQNRGYGGNQKLGYTFAIENGFDLVVMVHGDGQYPPEAIADVLQPFSHEGVGASFGSRFMRRKGAAQGGMPLYKRIANRFLTRVQNGMLKTQLSEFHSGFRSYSVETLAKLPFDLNSDDFHFDTEIIIQLNRAGFTIAEIDIPTYYGDEVCHVNGVKYGLNVLSETVKAMIHDRGLFYEPKYDLAEKDQSVARYTTKTDFTSPTTLAASRIRPGETVLDLGSGSGGLCDLLVATREVAVYGVDLEEPPNVSRYSAFWNQDLDAVDPLPPDLPSVDVIVLLDVIEHLKDPERFAERLKSYCDKHGTVRRVFVSTGNVGFAVIRAGLLAGQFNYGSRGILDRTHSRLFTLSSFRRLFKQAGFIPLGTTGVPVPFPLAIGNRKAASLMLTINEFLIRIWKRMFSYQFFMELEPLVPPSRVLDDSRKASEGLVERGVDS